MLDLKVSRQKRPLRLYEFDSSSFYLRLVLGIRSQAFLEGAGAGKTVLKRFLEAGCF